MLDQHGAISPFVVVPGEDFDEVAIDDAELLNADLRFEFSLKGFHETLHV